MKSPYFFGEKTELEKGKYKTSEKHFIMSKRKEVPLLPPQKKKKKEREKERQEGRKAGRKEERGDLSKGYRSQSKIAEWSNLEQCE